MDKLGHTGGVWRWVPIAGTPNSFEGDFCLILPSILGKNMALYRW